MRKEKIENDVEIVPNDLKKEKGIKRFSTIALSILTVFYMWKLNNNIKITSSFDAYKNKEEKLLELSNLIGITVDPKVDDNLLIMYYGLTNNNLSDEEKEGFLYLIELLRDNPYIDVNTIAKSIANLNVDYRTKTKEKETLAALYQYYTNTIRMYEDAPGYDRIYIHELIHAIFCHGKAVSLPKFIVEGVTELLVNEYYEYDWEKEKYSYVFDTVMIKVLCEMTSSDIVLKTYTLDDMQFLTDNLKEYMSEEEKNRYIKLAKDLFDKIDYTVAVPQNDLDELLLLTDKYLNAKCPNNEIVKERYHYYRGILEKMASKEPYKEAIYYINTHEVPLYPYFSKALKEQYLTSIDEDKKEIHEKQLILTNY